AWSAHGRPGPARRNPRPSRRPRPRGPGRPPWAGEVRYPGLVSPWTTRAGEAEPEAVPQTAPPWAWPASMGWGGPVPGPGQPMDDPGRRGGTRARPADRAPVSLAGLPGLGGAGSRPGAALAREHPERDPEHGRAVEQRGDPAEVGVGAEELAPQVGVERQLGHELQRPRQQRAVAREHGAELGQPLPHLEPGRADGRQRARE